MTDPTPRLAPSPAVCGGRCSRAGRVVRTLTRAAWGGPEHGPSPLEREFLSIIQNPPAREDPA